MMWHVTCSHNHSARLMMWHVTCSHNHSARLMMWHVTCSHNHSARHTMWHVTCSHKTLGKTHDVTRDLLPQNTLQDLWCDTWPAPTKHSARLMLPINQVLVRGKRWTLNIKGDMKIVCPHWRHYRLYASVPNQALNHTLAIDHHRNQ
jgi:hypothetical protein